MTQIMVEKDSDYSEILNYDGNNGMEIALVTGLMICVTAMGLYGTEIDPRSTDFRPSFDLSFQVFSFIRLV